MKNLKKLFLVPVLALGTISSCYSKNDTTCPEEKKCDACPESIYENSLDVTYENGDEVSNKLNLVYDESYPNLSGNTKKLKVKVPSNSTVKFKSSNVSAVSVTNDGTIKALQANKYSKITVNASNGKSREFEVYTFDMKTFFGINSSNQVTNCLDTEIEEIVFPENVVKISGSELGLKLTRLKRMIINEGCTEIVVNNNSNSPIPSTLEYLYIPSTLQKIGAESFVAPYLKQIEVSENNPYYKVYDNKFLYCTSAHLTERRRNYITRCLDGFDGNITQEMIDETGITGINHFAMSGLKSIEDLVLRPDISLQRWCIFSGSSVETVKIPKSFLDNIYNDINNSKMELATANLAKHFANCPNLSEVIIYDDNPVEDDDDDIYNNIITETTKYVSYEGALYFKNSVNNYENLVLGTNNGIINESTKSIEYFAFCGREFENTKIKIPSSVKKLSTCSFSLTNLEKIYLSNVEEESNNYLLQALSYSYNTVAEDLVLCMISKVFGTDGTELFLDNTTYQALGNKGLLAVFTLANQNLHIYDAFETDRVQSSGLLFNFQGRQYATFDYSYNVTEEEFDTL